MEIKATKTQNPTKKRFRKKIKNYRKQTISQATDFLARQDAAAIEHNKHFFEILHSPQIIPNRFLYHVSPREKREKIIHLGLLPHRYQNAVFANNMDIDYLHYFYPFCFDQWTARIFEHDIWIIDTSKFDSHWHIDPYMAQGPDYVCTQQNIPAYALRLVTIKPQKVSTCVCGDLHMTKFRMVHNERINEQLRAGKTPLPIVEPHTLCCTQKIKFYGNKK